MYQDWKVLVQPIYERQGMVESNTRDRYETIVSARGADEACRIAAYQCGGPDRCRVTFIGPA
jgi:hypothetical protein